MHVITDIRSLSASITILYLLPIQRSSNLSTLLHSPFKPLNPLTFANYSQSNRLQPPGSTRLLKWLSPSRPQVSSSPKFLIRSLVYCALAPWNGLAGDFRQLAHYPISPCQFHSSSGCTLLWCLPLTTEDRSLRNLY